MHEDERFDELMRLLELDRLRRNDVDFIEISQPNSSELILFDLRTIKTQERKNKRPAA